MNALQMHLSGAVRTLEHVTWPLEPIVGESLIGYLARTADYNAIRRPTVLLTDAGLPYHMRVGGIARTEYPLDGLAKVLGVDPQWMAERRHALDESDPTCTTPRYAVSGASIRAVHLEYWTRRVAPAALRLSEHHRELWHVATIPVCTRTWEVLLEACPLCGRVLDWKRMRGIARCTHDSCRADVSKASSSVIDEMLRPGIAICAGLIDPDPAIHEAALATLPATLRGENRGDLFELAWVLGCMEDPHGVAAIREPMGLDVDRRCAVLSRGGEFLATWPACLKTLLSRSIEDGSAGSGTTLLVERFRAVVRRPMLHGRTAALLDGELVGIRGNSFSTMIGQILGYMTTFGFSQATGLSRSQIRALRLANAVPHLVFRGGERTLASFSEETAKDVRRRLSERLSAVDFGFDLGVPVDGVYDLIAEGLLRVNEDPIIRTLWPELHVQVRGARELAASLQAEIPSATPSVTMARLVLALRSYPGPDKPWVAIVRSVLRGSLRLSRRPGEKFDLRKCYVELRDLPVINEMPTTTATVPAFPKPGWINDRDARDRLACDHRGLRHLVRSEQLVSSGLFTGATFARDDLDRLAASLIHKTEIGMRFGYVIRGGGSWHLKKAGMVPDEGGFFPREEACRHLGLR